MVLNLEVQPDLEYELRHAASLSGLDAPASKVGEGRVNNCFASRGHRSATTRNGGICGKSGCSTRKDSKNGENIY